MHWLVTAGGTSVPIDKVRSITNSSTGRTGAAIALAAYEAGHNVTLLTSRPDALREVAKDWRPSEARFAVRSFQTFHDLHGEMEHSLRTGAIDALVHAAAVSDYEFARAYGPALGTIFYLDSGEWRADGRPRMIDATAAKIAGGLPELWLRLLRNPKLIDAVRNEWQFRGVVVKFKLEVEVTDDDLLAIAEPSRQDSNADLMVANTLEGKQNWAWLGPMNGQYARVARSELPRRLVEAVAACHERRGHG